MSSQGPNNGSVFATAAYGGIDWSNPGNAQLEDGVLASTVSFVADTTYYLEATGFEFSIPAGATITGIVVDVKCKAQFNTELAYIYSRSNAPDIKLLKAGVLAGTSQATGTHWPTTLAYITHGNSSNLWGTTWTPSDINNSGFGVAVSVREDQGNNNTAYIDHIRITIYFTPLGWSHTIMGVNTPASIMGIANDGTIKTVMGVS